MSKPQDNICHPGIIQQISHKTISVSIVSRSACASCKSQKMCNIAEMKDKIIEIESPKEHSFKPGDKVEVRMAQSAGTWAVFLGYITPFIILISTLLIASLYVNEGIAGLLALASLLPYFIILYIFRKKLKRQFRFYLVKSLNTEDPLI